MHGAIMNFKSYILSASLSLLTALSAMGAQAENVTIVKQTAIYEGSSEHNRMGKEFLLSAQVAGFTVAPIPSVGINAGMYLNRNDIIQIEASFGTLPYFFFNLKSRTLGANYKHFFGNSFYTKIGVDHRTISISNINLFGYSDSNNSANEAQSLVGNFAIGNQWQWENFTVGCDWIGANPHLATLKANYDTTGISDANKKELDESWDRLAKVTSAQFLRFYLGASF